jgi:hypothetical protein
MSLKDDLMISEGNRMIFKRNLLRFCLAKAQNLSFYKAIARSGRWNIVIEEAKEIDMQKVNSWLFQKHKTSELYKQNITNFVAKKGEKVIGFVQLIRNPNESSCAGYWLFSLSVKILYRRGGKKKMLKNYFCLLVKTISML